MLKSTTTSAKRLLRMILYPLGRVLVTGRTQVSTRHCRGQGTGRSGPTVGIAGHPLPGQKASTSRKRLSRPTNPLRLRKQTSATGRQYLRRRVGPTPPRPHGDRRFSLFESTKQRRHKVRVGTEEGSVVGDDFAEDGDVTRQDGHL